MQKMSPQSSFQARRLSESEIVSVIRTAAAQVKAEDGTVEEAIERARDSIITLDEEQGRKTLYTPEALRNAVQQAWGQESAII